MAVSGASLARLPLSSSDHCCLSPILLLLGASSSAHPLSLPLFLHSFLNHSATLHCLQQTAPLSYYLSLSLSHTHTQKARARPAHAQPLPPLHAVSTCSPIINQVLLRHRRRSANHVVHCTLDHTHTHTHTQTGRRPQTCSESAL